MFAVAGGIILAGIIIFLFLAFTEEIIKIFLWCLGVGTVFFVIFVALSIAGGGITL